MFNDSERRLLFPGILEAVIIIFATFFLIIASTLLFQALGLQRLHEKLPLLVGEFMVIVPVYISVRRHEIPFRDAFRLNPVTLRLCLLSIVLGLAATVISDEIGRLVEMVLPLPEDYKKFFENTLLASSFSDWVMLTMAAVVLAGVFEEMLFRGFLLNVLEERMDVTGAVLVSALVFSILHLNPWGVAQIVLLGVLLGVLTWKSNSIYPAIILHATNNLLSLLVFNLNDGALPEILESGDHIHPVVLLLAAAVLYFGVVMFYRFAEEDTEIPTLLNRS